MLKPKRLSVIDDMRDYGLTTEAVHCPKRRRKITTPKGGGSDRKNADERTREKILYLSIDSLSRHIKSSVQ